MQDSRSRAAREQPEKLALYPERCTGCLCCALACSLRYSGSFDPELAFIRATGVPENPAIWFDDGRTECLRCAAYVPMASKPHREEGEGMASPAPYQGYAGRILYVDLKSGSFEIEHLPRDWCEDFLGGFGINNRLCLEVMTPGTDPLSPDNPVVLGAGPLVGTLAPGSARVVANSRLPLTGAVASAGGGMGLGPHMRWAGYDHVVLRGAARHPVYLLVDEEGARLEDAGDLWGTDSFACTDHLCHRHSGASVTAIGQAGENLVPFSLALIDKGSTLGRGGLGAVLELSA